MSTPQLESECAICHNEKPLVKWLSDEGAWLWLGLECAAERGSPLAIQLKTTRWIEGMLEPVIPIEGVQ